MNCMELCMCQEYLFIYCVLEYRNILSYPILAAEIYKNFRYCQALCVE